MKKVNEPSIRALSQARKQDGHSFIRNIEVSCCKCGYKTKFSLNSKRDLDNWRGGRWVCKECTEKGKKELQQAILNLAKNKKGPRK